MHPSIDTSTLNLDEIRKLPTYELPVGYFLGGYGSGCYLDAPGFPSYMVQPVYTRQGNSPSHGPELVLELDGVLYAVKPECRGGSWEEHHAAYERLLHRIWKPLPLDHERVYLWKLHVYQHFNHCYRDVERPEYNKPGTLIFPLPHYKLEHPRTFSILATATDEEIAKIREAQDAEIARVRSLNEAEQLRCARVAVPDNHLAVITIRKFYPTYEAEQNYIDAAPRLAQADWWETASEKPAPEACEPRNSLGKGSHTVTWMHSKKPGHHCHFCGHDNPK